MKYAHESTECNNLRYQFPKFCLVLHFLRRSMYRALDERATIDWNEYQENKVIVLNLAEKAVLNILLTLLDYINNALRKKQLLISNAEHLKAKSWKH